MTRSWQVRCLGIAATLIATTGAGLVACSPTPEERGIIVGRSTTTLAPATTVPPTEPTTTTEPSTTTTTAPPPPTTQAAPPVVQYGPDGAPYGPAVPYTGTAAVPDHLVFVLVIGSDARPGHDPLRGNADSLHLVAVDPASGRGTIVGFPRDSWVQIPGKGTRKINAALPLGGPKLMAETIRSVTGLPVDYYVVTGFAGLEAMVNDLGGLNVHVDRRMRDRPSGAFFDPGWHMMTGDEALAFARNRKDVPAGDFSRSENQGKLLMAALGKLRVEVGDAVGLARWLEVLSRHASLDVPLDSLDELATMARNLDPANMRNLVLTGRVGNAGGQSVVFLSPANASIYEDLRADAVIGS